MEWSIGFARTLAHQHKPLSGLAVSDLNAREFAMQVVAVEGKDDWVVRPVGSLPNGTRLLIWLISLGCPRCFGCYNLIRRILANLARNLQKNEIAGIWPT